MKPGHSQQDHGTVEFSCGRLVALGPVAMPDAAGCTSEISTKTGRVTLLCTWSFRATVDQHAVSEYDCRECLWTLTSLGSLRFEWALAAFWPRILKRGRCKSDASSVAFGFSIQRVAFVCLCGRGRMRTWQEPFLRRISHLCKWLWLKIKQEGLGRFWSMFPLTRVPLWYRFFEPQPN